MGMKIKPGRPASQRQAARLKLTQRGAIVPAFVVIMILILGFMGLALDGSRLFNRQVELQTVADLAAMSAAQKLVGTASGIDDALSAAAAAATAQKFHYGKSSVSWSDAAVQFSASPSSGWVDASAAKSAPANIMYAKVDTDRLAPEVGTIQVMFLKVINEERKTASTSARAIAGRSMVNTTPFAVCAMSNTAAAPRAPNAELVEYGFRRGVGYDLMQLNPNGAAPANFVVNPIDPSGSPGSAVNTSTAVVGPFVCAGAMPAVGGPGGRLKVAQPFPLSQLYHHLNSRFGDYAANACDFRSAPPDTNIKWFNFDAPASWMKTTPAGQTAASLIKPGRLETIADPDPLPGDNTAQKYGQMWTYARPVPFSAYVPGLQEPVAGYLPFATSLWPALNMPGAPEPKASYPAATPYMSGGGAFHVAPPATYGRPLRHRRVLHVPLLACPVSGADATVLAIGRFFMTVPATDTTVQTEFAGIATGNSLRGPVELVK